MIMGRWAPPELVAAGMTGDEPAIERLVGEIWAPCFRLAAAVIGDWNLAQDAAQEACIIVFDKIATLRHAEAFDMWLYRIVIRESARARRRSAHNVATLYESGFGADPTVSIDVWRSLGGLPPGLRDVTVLFYFHDLKSEKISKILRVPHATVRTRLARARERLRVLLGDYGNEQPGGNEGGKYYAV